MGTNGSGYLRTSAEVISGKVLKKTTLITWQSANKASDTERILIVLVLSFVYTVYIVKRLGVEVIGVRVGTTKQEVKSVLEGVDIFKVLGGKCVWRRSGGVRGSGKLQLLIKSKKECKLML